MVMDSQQSRHHSQLAASAAAVDFKPSTSAGMVHKGQTKGQEGDFLPVEVTDRIPLSVKELMAGGVAGALAKSSVAPFERIKILYQVFLIFPNSLVIMPLDHISFPSLLVLYAILLQFIFSFCHLTSFSPWLTY
jgi:hypothetical protein